MEPEKIVQGAIGGMSLLFSIIFALSGFLFFTFIGYLIIVETSSIIWKTVGGFCIFCGIFILVFILGTIYLTFNKSSSK
jgi:hypothetical protein